MSDEDRDVDIESDVSRFYARWICLLSKIMAFCSKNLCWWQKISMTSFKFPISTSDRKKMILKLLSLWHRWDYLLLSLVHGSIYVHLSISVSKYVGLVSEIAHICLQTTKAHDLKCTNMVMWCHFQEKGRLKYNILIFCLSFILKFRLYQCQKLFKYALPRYMGPYLNSWQLEVQQYYFQCCV